ncbi:MAG: hypothetical protein EPO27_06325 [Betaproteobacteria bacterium]|nr:MAG: hypothetical protein EPO27_06325 [Betaproteobacteria bacterium]
MRKLLISLAKLALNISSAPTCTSAVRMGFAAFAAQSTDLSTVFVDSCRCDRAGALRSSHQARRIRSTVTRLHWLACALCLLAAACAERPRIGVTVTNAPSVQDCIAGSATKPCP